MSINSTIELLKNNACPSIQYRTRKEILGESITSQFMQDLQEMILQDDKVMEVFSWCQEDGWLGGYFHGNKEPESGIRYLCEKGIEGNNPTIIGALNALINRGDAFDKGSMENVGKPLDFCHMGGSQMIKACVFAYAGHEEYDFIKKQIIEALSGFEYLLSINDLNDIYHVHKNTVNVFNDGTKWPSIYHLRLLAHTKSWKNSNTIKMLSSAFNKLFNLSPIPPIKLLYANQIISPASAFMNNFSKNMEELTAKEWMMWFHRTEMITRLGIANNIASLKQQIDYLHHYLAE